MKKLIIILFLFSFWANAQIELAEDYSFTYDKKKHTYTAAGLSVLSYGGIYAISKDAEVSFMGGFIIPVIFAAGKEGFDFISGGTISLADLSYGTASSVITSGLMYAGTKLVEKIRKGKAIQEQLKKEDITFALENEIFKKH